MKRKSLSLFLIIYLVLTAFSVDISEKARNFYISAMSSIGAGNNEAAMDYYEKALDEDAKILGFDDKGLLNSLILKYLKKENEKSSDITLERLGFLFRISGKYEESENFYKKLLKDFPESQFKKKAEFQIYEISVIRQHLNPEKKTSSTSEVIIEQKPEEKEKQEKLSAEEIEEQKKKQLAERYSTDISAKEDEVAKLKNDYELWFSLEYGKHDYPKEDYNEAMVYFYEKKLKEAEKQLQELKEKLEKLKK